MLINPSNMHFHYKLLKGDIIEGGKVNGKKITAMQVFTKVVLNEQLKGSKARTDQTNRIKSLVSYTRIRGTQSYEILSNLTIDKDNDYAKEDIDYLITSYLAYQLKNTASTSVYINEEGFTKALAGC